MTINATYIATVLNSMIRMTSPILLAALTAAICNKVKVFNIGMEGTMMAGAFFFAVSNKSRTRLAPTPTNISTKSEPEIE